MKTTESHLNRVIDGITECWNDTGKEKPCGKTPIAIAIDPYLPKESNLLPMCIDCLIKHKQNNEYLSLADFVNLLTRQQTAEQVNS